MDKLKKRRFKYIPWSIVRIVLVFGLSFLILKPFLNKLLMSFMTQSDLTDPTVNLIPTQFAIDFWRTALNELNLKSTFFVTVISSLSVAFIQMMICAMIGYGFARFKFKGKKVIFYFVILLMLIPPQVYSVAQYLNFAYFHLGLVTVNLIDTMFPLYILAFTGLGMKEAFYIFLMRSFFEGLPEELENAAYIDGAGTFTTFFRIILPNARNILMTVFLFSFCWQWTDLSYSQLYFVRLQTIAQKIPGIIIRNGLNVDPMSTSIVQNTSCLVIIIPLIFLYIAAQKTLMKSISTSGQAN